MEKYWKKKKQSAPPTDNARTTSDDAGSASLLSDYDRYRLTLLSTTQRSHEEWQAELRRYEKNMPEDVSPDTDIIEWWQVRLLIYPTRNFH